VALCTSHVIKHIMHLQMPELDLANGSLILWYPLKSLETAQATVSKHWRCFNQTLIKQRQQSRIIVMWSVLVAGKSDFLLVSSVGLSLASIDILSHKLWWSALPRPADALPPIAEL